MLSTLDLDSTELDTPAGAERQWRDYLDLQSRALDKVGMILDLRGPGAPTPLDLEQVDQLTALTSIAQPDCDLPSVLAEPARAVHRHILATTDRLAQARDALGEQLDQLRAGSLTQDKGPVFLDTRG